MAHWMEDFLEFLLRTVGGMFLLCLLVVLVFLAIFWPAPENEPMPWLGIVGKNITTQMVEKNRLPFNRGVYLEKVFANSPGDYANLAPGDYIVKFNNTIVMDKTQLADRIFDMDPNEKVWMAVYRDGAYYNVMLKLATKPMDQSFPATAVAFQPTLAAATAPIAPGGATAPPIAADAALPHAYRGICSNCHVIVSQSQLNQPNTQLVAAIRQRQVVGGTRPAPIAPPPGAGSWGQLPTMNNGNTPAQPGFPGAIPPTPLEEFTWAGIGIETFNPVNAAALGVAPNTVGVTVDEVLLGTRGERGGVMARDLIREINGCAIYDVDSFANVVQAQRLTGGVLLITRAGKSMHVTVPEF